MDRMDVIEKYGIDPETIGRRFCFWAIIEECLVVTTQDKDPITKSLNPEPSSVNHDNFMWVSGDTVDKRAMHYWYAPLGKKKEIIERIKAEEPEEDHAALIMKKYWKERNHGNR